MATYLALTTHNYQQNGYHEVARGNKKQDVRAAAEQHGSLQGHDVYAETYRRNLIVVSKTAAKRRYGFNADSWY